MPRPKRISFPGAVYHIWVRGNNRQFIFKDDYDCLKFLEILRAYKQKYGFFIYAYILIPNHIHLVIEISEKAGISRIMQAINTAYSRYFNERHHLRGHLLENRFQSCLVSKDRYLLEITCYVHLNPIRLGVVTDPEAYKWSSFQAYSEGQDDGLVDREVVLDLLSQDKAQQAKLYSEFIQDKAKDGARELSEKIRNSRFFGNEGFVDKIRQEFLPYKTNKRGRPRKIVSDENKDSLLNSSLK